MASGMSRSSVDISKRRPLVRSKQLNEALLKAGTRRILMSLSQMSPEAQRAMILTQEGANEKMFNTENIKPDNKSLQGQCRKTNSIYTEHEVHSVEAEKDFRSISELVAKGPEVYVRALPGSRRTTTSSFETSVETGISRSRSTLSTAERNHSVSDNLDSCYNYNNTKNFNRINNRNKSHDNENISNSSAKYQQRRAVVHNSADESDNNNGEINNNTELPIEEHRRQPEICVQEELGKEEQSRRPESFVLALDRALEDKCISRLSGDVTNTAGISELGKVRALDGGRLTNAQEVVVNVCYDDDRELIFHDNDDENMSNVRATSNIRINLWMEYNERFQPDDIPEVTEAFETNNNEANSSHISESTTCSQTTTSLPKPKSRNVNRPTVNRTVALTKQTSKNKWPAVKSDLNNNKTNCKSKTNGFKSGKTNSCSRTESTEILDGHKRHVSSVKPGIKK